MTNQPSGGDVWYARNQPNGYWRVGNPIVKLSAILFLSIGLVARDASLVSQSSLLIWIMLWLPFKATSKFSIVVLHLGVGGVLVGLIAPGMLVNYSDLDFNVPIEHVASLRFVDTVCIVVAVFSYFFVAQAITSRDFAWLITLFPKSERSYAASYVFSYAYAAIRLPSIVRELHISMLSRGLHLPLSPFHYVGKFDSLGIWSLGMYREMKEMASTIEYQVVSRLKPESRKTPVGAYFSITDYSVAGIFVTSIVLPRILLILA